MRMLGKFGGVKLALLGVVGAAAIGYAGYRMFFARTGEAAIGLIPADATCIVTLDAHPSEGQIGAFTKLSNALKREGLDKDLEEGASGIIGKAGLGTSVRQYLTGNLACAFWMPETTPNGGSAKPHGAVLFSITNPSAVSGIISSGTRVEGASVPTFKFNEMGMVTAVVGDYLVVSSDGETVSRIEATRKGADSIAGLSEYKAAREALPADANMMVFVSPKAVSQLQKMGGQNAPNTTMWMSFGASLRDAGLQFDFRGPVDTKMFPGMAALANAAPLDKGLLRKLPADAYGVVAYANLDKYYSTIETSAKQMPNGQKSFEEGKAQFEKQSGISVENDILPAFKGDAVLAVYPDASNSLKSVDGLVLIDNANGGNPAALADKVRLLIEKKSAEEAAKSGHPAVHFTETKSGNTTIWALDEASAAEMQKSMGSHKEVNGQIVIDPAFANKNLSFAVNNGTLVVASSTAMMTKAMLVFNGDRSLADDPAFADMASRVQDNAQGMIMVSISRIIERFRPNIEDSMKNQKDFAFDDFLNLFGGPNSGLVGYGRVDGKASTATLFVPLDYDRMAKMIHSAKMAASRPPSDEVAVPMAAPSGTMGTITR